MLAESKTWIGKFSGEWKVLGATFGFLFTGYYMYVAVVNYGVPGTGITLCIDRKRPHKLY